MTRLFVTRAALMVACLLVPLATMAAGPRPRGEGRPEFGWLIEPWVGGIYGTVASDISTPVNATTSASVIGPAVGVQAGPIYRYWFAAVRGSYLLPTSSSLSGSPKDLQL